MKINCVCADMDKSCYTIQTLHPNLQTWKLDCIVVKKDEVYAYNNKKGFGTLRKIYLCDANVSFYTYWLCL